jgi:hypothetical protein
MLTLSTLWPRMFTLYSCGLQCLYWQARDWERLRCHTVDRLSFAVICILCTENDALLDCGPRMFTLLSALKKMLSLPRVGMRMFNLSCWGLRMWYCCSAVEITVHCPAVNWECFCRAGNWECLHYYTVYWECCSAVMLTENVYCTMPYSKLRMLLICWELRMFALSHCELWMFLLPDCGTGNVYTAMQWTESIYIAILRSENVYTAI